MVSNCPMILVYFCFSTKLCCVNTIWRMGLSFVCLFLQTMKMTYKDFLGFSEPELKQLLVSDPKLYSSGKFWMTR